MRCFTLLQRQRLYGLLALAIVLLLSGCGFALRQPPTYAFQTIAIADGAHTPVAAALAPYLGDKLVPIAIPKGGKPPEVILSIMQFEQKKTVAGVSLAGQVRNFLLTTKVVFSLRNAEGDDLLSDIVLSQRRSISYNESEALAKGVEENFLNQDMLNELALQLVHRLEAVKTLG